MSLLYSCKKAKRSQILRDSAVMLNGIDYLEVLDSDAPEGIKPQRILLVHMLKTAPWGLTTDNIQIDGGVRITDIKALWAIRATDASNEMVNNGIITEAEKAFFLTLSESSNILVVRINVNGDFSPYTLRLVKSSTVPLPPDGFDPILSQVEFSFKADCPSDFDCKVDVERSDKAEAAPPIDYLAKDYASFRRLMLDRLAIIMPDWEERNPADIGIALVEALAYFGDYLSYFQDAVATEAYLGTARKRVSIHRHARLLDYAMHNGCNARTWAKFDIKSNNITLKEGTPLLTRINGQTTCIKPELSDQAYSQRPIVFETMYEATFFKAHNSMEFYTWGESDCYLLRGATRATLKGSLPELKIGDVLIFVEKRGPQSGRGVDANPSHRHAVRLTGVTQADDPMGGQFLDTPTNISVPVTEIKWASGDALPFSFCISPIEVPDEERIEGEPELQPVSIVLGNIVLADHGQTIEVEDLGIVPSIGRYNPRLERTGITYCEDSHWKRNGNNTDFNIQAAAGMLKQDVRNALPAVFLHGDDQTWVPYRDLLNSDNSTPDFVVELEEDGYARIRFGDGKYGRRPTEGTSFEAVYRVGNGHSGNIGAQAINHIVTDSGVIETVSNPLPAQGGTNPESIEEVRQYAPQSFRTQERAVTEADYAETAQRHPEVQRAIATRRWTGSWYTMFLTIDRKGGLPVDDSFEVALRAFLERYRLAGHDIEVDGPSFVPLDIAFTVCVESGYFRSDVKAALLEAFSNSDLPDGRCGFFHPDNFTFGQRVYLSAFLARAMQVPGVRWVDTQNGESTVNRFRRWGQSTHGEFECGWIDIGRLEVARLDNDPNAPENGKLEFYMEGGL